MTREEAEADMGKGFRDGYNLSLPWPGDNHSFSYRHGFANGRRDKRVLVDGKTAQELRETAEACIRIDTGQWYERGMV